MRVPISEVGRCGRLELTFALQERRTVLRQSYAEVPFKITRMLAPRHACAHLIIMQCTAGLFGGDEVDCSIQVQRGAHVLVTQQSATRIHPSGERRAVQRTRVRVESGARLTLILEPVIPFAGSILNQTSRIEVETGARLVYWEGFMAGRIGSGERWRFRQVASETSLRRDDRTLFLDRFRLEPGRDRSSTGPLAGPDYVGTGLYFGDGAGRFTARLHQDLPEAGVDLVAPDLAIVRIAADSGPDFHRAHDTFRRHAEDGSLASEGLDRVDPRHIAD